MQRFSDKETRLIPDDSGYYVLHADAEQELADLKAGFEAQLESNKRFNRELERLREQLAAANATIEQNVALINRLTEAGGHLRATIERLSAELNRGMSDSAHAARKAQ